MVGSQPLKSPTTATSPSAASAGTAKVTLTCPVSCRGSVPIMTSTSVLVMGLVTTASEAFTWSVHRKFARTICIGTRRRRLEALS